MVTAGMLPLLLLLSSTLYSIVRCEDDTQCTYTVAGWSNRSGTALMTSLSNDSLCGVPWGPLVRKRPIQLIVSDNTAWLLATQAYIAASLNWRRLASRETLALWSSDRYGNLTITVALALMGDSLARACDNMAQWSFSGGGSRSSASTIMRLLDDFSNGMLDEAPSCDDEFDMLAVSLALDTLYYINGNDVIVSRDPATNLTRISSLVDGLYATHYGLYALCSFLIILVLLLGLKLVLVLHQSHVYRINKRDGGNDDIPFVEYDIDTGGSNEPLNASTSSLQLQLNIQQHGLEHFGVKKSGVDMDPL